MGNYDSHCCEGNTEEDEKRNSNHSVQVPAIPQPLITEVQAVSQLALDSGDPLIEHTPKTVSNDDFNLSPNKSAGMHFDPRSPSCQITRTPVGPVKKFAAECLIDPRSPSVGIDRTPILAGGDTESSEASFNQTPVKIPQSDIVSSNSETANEETNFRNLIDPRSPTTELHRTPLKIENHDKEKTKQNEEIKLKGLEDPRSPTTEVSRTPLKIGAAESLRRTVLLSNTFTPTLNPPLQAETEVLSEKGDKLEPTILNLSSGLLNLSCASNLNVSQSSSMMATCGSDSLNVESIDIEDISTDAAFSDDEMPNEENDHGKSLVSMVTTASVEGVVKDLIINVEKVSKKHFPQEVEQISFTEDIQANRSTPKQNEEKQLSFYRDNDENKDGSANDSTAEQSDSSMLNKSGLKPPRKVLSVHKVKSKKAGSQEGKQNVRYPLAVLGHSNSPDFIKPQQLSLKKPASRVPRYRGKNSAMRLSNSLGCTPPRADVAKYGKEN